MDRAAERVVTITHWDTEQHARFSRQAIGDAASQVQAAGIRLGEAEIYETVAASDLARENEAMVRRCWQAAFNDGNLSALDEYVTEDYTWHGPAPEIRGRENMKGFVTLFLTAFPDLSLHFEDQIGAGKKVASRWTGRGTHQGEFLGIPATGKTMTLPGLVISRLVDGKIAEEWETFDVLGMMQQLGVMPAVAQVPS